MKRLYNVVSLKDTSIVGWVEKRNPTPLTITPLILGLKLFHFMPLRILLQPNLQKLQNLRNWHIGRVCQISTICLFAGFTAVPDIHKVQILIIKLLWCGHLGRTRCTSLKATCCIYALSEFFLDYTLFQVINIIYGCGSFRKIKYYIRV